ncbi:MAG: hypothetical protein EA426_03585 [Spirochaetaceae bacterium]|nr:MAG: hypothetical protein EA426_03585 [Spirochaetaceae bacterium]
MTKIAVVVFADGETHGDQGRVANALELAKEAKNASSEVKIIFDGAGTKWVPILNGEDSKLSVEYRQVADTVHGACAFCAAAFGVKDEIKATGVRLLGEFEGHPSLHTLIVEGYTVVKF